MAKNIISLTLVVLFCTLAGFSLLQAGLPPTHDGEYHVIRFYLFNESILDGNLYPRWASYLNNNFGVPLFTFVYPLPNYVAYIFHLFGISFIDSFKLEMFFATLMGGVFFYLWAKEFWGRLGGTVSAVFYVFSPYHFLDIYIRGSVGEVWALGFFPAFLWAFTIFINNKRILYFLLSSIFLSLIIFSHNILALMFVGFSISYVIFCIFVNKNKSRVIIKSFFIFLLGLGISAIFWIPALYETKYVTGLKIFDVASHFPELFQLLFPSWGSGFSGAELQNELSFQIGLANLIAIILSLTIAFSQLLTRKKSNYFNFLVFFLFWFFFVFFLMLESSRIIWQSIPFMNFFQFPWRLLSLEILFASFLVGSVFYFVNDKFRIFKKLLAGFLIFITFSLGIGYAKPAYYHIRDDNYYISRSNFIDGTNSPGNTFNTIFMKSIPKKEKEKIKFLKGKGSIVLNDAKSSSYLFTINSIDDSEIIVNLAYYPGWKVYSNDIDIAINPANDGRFTFFLPKGQNTIKIVFEDTPIRKISVLISSISLIIIFILSIKKGLLQLNK